MLPRRTTLAALVIAPLAVVVTGCGALAEEAAERAVEEAAEEAAGGGEIDIDGGSVNIQTDEGSMTVDEDGNMVITDADGNVVTQASEEDGRTVISTEDGESTFTVGEDSLPEGWPGPDLPSGFTVVNGSRVEGAQNSWSVGYTFDGSFDDACSAMEGSLGGWTQTFKTVTSGEGANCLFGYESDAYQLTANVTETDRIDAFISVTER
jgi:hypothetical protein